MALQQVGVEEVGYWMTFPMSSPSFVDTIVSPKVKGGDLSESTDDAPAKVRKPYTITKQRERWTEEEHEKFLEALKLYGRAWRHIEEHIGTKTAVQIRSHAQKFFSKLEREASLGGSSATGGSGDIEIPPPRPKRKPSHPYPRKAGGAFSGSPSFEEDGKSPLAVCSALTPLESPTGTNAWKAPRKVLQEAFHKTGSAAASLRLFGQTVVVPGSEKPEADIDQDEFSHSIACLESTGSPRSQVSVGTEEMPGITPPISNAESGVWDIKPQGCKSTAGFQAWVKDSEAARAKVSSHMDKPYENNVAVSSSVAYECQVFHQAMTGQNLSGSCFTPWQPTSFAIGGNHTAPFPASIPMFWQGLVPHNFCHSKNEDANAASAIAAATFAVASAWQAIQGAIPVANNDSNISMVYSPIAMLAAVGKPVPVLGTQSPRPQSPFKLNVNACEIKKREQGGNHKCNAGNGNEDDPTSVHGEDSTAECCSSLTDASRLSCYESNDEGSPAKKRPRSSREVYMHMDREASKPQYSDSKSNAKVGMPTSIGNGLEVIGSSNGFVAVHLVMTPDCMDEVIGPNDKDVTEKSSVEQLLQSEANYQQKVRTDEEDSADNGNNDAEQQRDMHNQSGLLCESMQACGAIQHDLPMETNEGANEEERPSKDNNQCYDSNKETVLSMTMSHLGENKATSSKECCASSCLITESKDANMLQTDVNGRCTETGEHLFMLKAGSTLSSRYSGVGFIPYKRSLRMESSSMKVDKA